MSNIFKFAIAVVLAATAGVMNLVYLANQTKPMEFVGLAGPIQAGDQFSAEMSNYERVQIAQVSDSLKSSLIPFDQVAVLFNARAARDLEAHDPVFFRDIAGSVPEYKRLGPFTLLSVGSEFTGAREPGQSSDGGGDTITVTAEPQSLDEAGVGVRGEYNDATSILLQIIEAQRGGRDKASSYLRIVTIEVRPTPIGEPLPDLPDASESTEESSKLAQEEGMAGGVRNIDKVDRAIIVPLEGVRSIPDVLFAGQEIYFVVPADALLPLAKTRRRDSIQP